MMTVFEQMLQEQHAMLEVVATVERLMQQNEQFNGKDASRYLRDYKAEILRCGILEGLHPLIGWLQISFKGASMRYGNKIRLGRPLKKRWKRHSTLLKTPPSQCGGDSRLGGNTRKWAEVSRSVSQVVSKFRESLWEVVRKRSSYPRTGQGGYVSMSHGCSELERSWSASRGYDYWEWPHQYMGKYVGLRCSIRKEGEMARWWKEESYGIGAEAEIHSRRLQNTGV